MIGVLLCDDLIFTSRIVGTANAHGLTLHTAKTVAELRRILQQSPPRCVILDLHLAGADIDQLADDIKQMKPRPTLVGYGSHVDTATLKRARDAGCDIVWPRSKFVEELETALPGWFDGEV
jgi:CheY-like chemotaxis protein